MHELPIAPAGRILKSIGATRVSPTAQKTLIEALEDYAEVIGKKAIDLARHAGRKTVTSDDIKLALK